MQTSHVHSIIFLNFYTLWNNTETRWFTLIAKIKSITCNNLLFVIYIDVSLKFQVIMNIIQFIKNLI